MGQGIVGVDISDEDLAGMAEVFGAAVAPEFDAAFLLTQAVEHDPTPTVSLTVNFGDRSSVEYPELDVATALQLSQNPSAYNSLLRGSPPRMGQSRRR